MIARRWLHLSGATSRDFGVVSMADRNLKHRLAIIDAAQLALALIRLEELGFGGQGEPYIHGMNGTAEAVRQLRGTSVSPVPGVSHVPVPVTAGTGVPTSGLVVGRALTRSDHLIGPPPTRMRTAQYRGHRST